MYLENNSFNGVSTCRMQASTENELKYIGLNRNVLTTCQLQQNKDTEYLFQQKMNLRYDRF